MFGSQNPEQQREMRDRALHASTVAMVLTRVSEDGPRIEWVSPAFEHTTGYAVADVIGQKPGILQGEDTDPKTARKLSQAIRNGQETKVTILNYRADGKPFWNQVSISPMRDSAGMITHWVGLQVDVTDQIDEQARQRSFLDHERRSREALTLVSQVADILAEVDSPTVLDDVCVLLNTDPIAWSGFYLAEQTLAYSPSLVAEDIDGQRTLPDADSHSSPALSERRKDAPADPVTQLLHHRLRNGVELELTPDSQTPVTAWLITDVLERLGEHEHSGMALLLPIVGRSKTLGMLVAVPVEDLATCPNREPAQSIFDEASLSLLHITARRVGISIDNARLYRREHQLAETLQRAMLPQQEPITGLDIWTYYAPSSDHAQVGGDWYDVMELSPQLVGIVIGDVVGHDVEAAATMGQLRSVVRAYAFELRGPATVIERVDSLASGMGLSRPASFVFLTLDRGPMPWRLEYSLAGHLPGMLLRDGQVQLLDGGKGPLIGFHGGPRTAEGIDVQEGDVIVLYTDGLIERRDRSLKDGMEELKQVLLTVNSSEAAAIGEQLLAELAQKSQDDVAVVVVRIPETAEQPDVGELTGTDTGPRSRRWQLAPLPSSIAQARHAVLRTCATWKIPDVGSAELVVSELVANAVLHGWGPVTLRLFDTGDGLRVEVEDANPAPPVVTDGHPGRVGGYGVQIVARLSDWGWRSAGEGKVVWAKIRPGSDDKIT